MATPGADPVIHVDVDDDRDSAVGDDNTSSTARVASSILNYRFENGRTYYAYKDGKNNRLDLQHNLFLLTFDNKLGLSPPNLPEFKTDWVLDLGTGTGIWAIDFADGHPETEVIGVDLSPTQPEFVPPNLKFEIDDIDEDWTYSQPFDYIHSKNWPKYLRKTFESCSSEMVCFLAKAAQEHRTPLIETDRLKHLMAEVGFVHVKKTPFKWPTNRWPKEKRFKELREWSNVNIDDRAPNSVTSACESLKLLI
ncbi:S-adenosyl-L-methionine-dependent methyltransferase [Dactylonectria macrodidyma]|uniref:S-adenosyl-L-methionine-dependent methyltransferase n=1 Tax=Dactylonectria macrodidyma TaxID=307937 RepID=A0A9P9IMJ9_9HYPO|nr:S-adenosyl-L-methionine-dependent methyltransferase [Dactylonectria macrodidyma]